MSSSSEIIIKQEQDVNMSWSQAAAVAVATDLNIPNSVIKSENEIMGMDTKTEVDFASHPIMKEYEGNRDENVGKADTTTVIEAFGQTKPKRVISFDYDKFCSDMSEDSRQFFKGCLRKSTPNSNSKEGRKSPATCQFLTIPKVHYGGGQSNRKHPSKGKSKSPNRRHRSSSRSSGSEVSDVEMETEMGRDSNHNKIDEESDFEIKEPMVLQRKKIRAPTPQILIQPENPIQFCSIM